MRPRFVPNATLMSRQGNTRFGSIDAASERRVVACEGAEVIPARSGGGLDAKIENPGQNRSHFVEAGQ